MRRNTTYALASRMLVPTLALAAVVTAGTFGYYLLGEGRHDLFACFYMVMITLSTVGYGEVIDISHDPHARLFTVGLILAGMGALAAFATRLTALVVEGELMDAWVLRRKDRMLSEMRDHYIVCGVGRVGRHIIEELRATHRSFVAIDVDERVEASIEDGTVRGGGARGVFLKGDALDDAVLEQAGLLRARGLAAVLPDDKDNLFLVHTAAHTNPTLRIVARASAHSSTDKLIRAGAAKVVSVSLIGGLRIVSELVRPAVTGFLDHMLRDRESPMRVEEVTLRDGSPWAGRQLAECGLRDDPAALVLAVRRVGGAHYVYNPPRDYRLAAGETLVLLATTERAAELRAHA